MALPHLQSGELGNVLPLDEKFDHTESHALFKSTQLQVLRIVLPAGKTLPEHKVAGEITLQCLEGSCELQANGQTHRMIMGDFMLLDGGVPHALTALTNTSILVTICLVPASQGA